MGLYGPFGSCHGWSLAAWWMLPARAVVKAAASRQYFRLIVYLILKPARLSNTSLASRWLRRSIFCWHRSMPRDHFRAMSPKSSWSSSCCDSATSLPNLAGHVLVLEETVV